MTPTEWLTRREAQKQGVDPDFATRILKQESGGRINVRSKAGAIGPMQLMPDTAKGMGVDPNDAVQNIQGGVKYLKKQLDTFGGDQRLGAAAYNAGPGAVRKYGDVPPYKETQAYVKNVATNDGSDNMGDRIAQFLTKRQPKGNTVAAQKGLGLSVQTTAPKGEFDFSKFGANAEFRPEEIKQAQERNRHRITPRVPVMSPPEETPEQFQAAKQAEIDRRIRAGQGTMGPVASLAARAGGEGLSTLGNTVAGLGMGASPTGPISTNTGMMLQQMGKGAARSGHEVSQRFGAEGLLGDIAGETGRIGVTAPLFAIPGAGGVLAMGAQSGLESLGGGASPGEALKQGAITSAGIGLAGKLGNVAAKTLGRVPSGEFIGRSLAYSAAPLMVSSAVSGELPTKEQVIHAGIFGPAFAAGHPSPVTEFLNRRNAEVATHETGVESPVTQQSPSLVESKPSAMAAEVRPRETVAVSAKEMGTGFEVPGFRNISAEASKRQIPETNQVEASQPEPPKAASPLVIQSSPTSESKPPIFSEVPLLEGKERRLPQTLEAAELEGGVDRTYQPSSILGGSEQGREIVKDKGVDGAIEHVLHGDAGIEWASTGYAAMEHLRNEEAKIRTTDPTAADEIAAKRLKFVGDFAAEATKRGQAIAGIRAIEEFAPDRAVYAANKLSQAGRKRGLSRDEEARIAKTGNELQAARDRIATLEAQLEAQAATKNRSVKEAKKANYQTRLEEQGATAKQALAGRLANLDFGNLGRPGERGAVKVGEPPLPGDAELVAQYAASRLNKLNTAAELNAELTKEFGNTVEPILGDVRRRAYAIRQEARLAEIADSAPERRRTILQEIQGEVRERQQKLADVGRVEQIQEGIANKGIAEARAEEAAKQKTEAAKRAAMTQEQRQQADMASRAKRIQEGIASDAEKEAQRERLIQTRKEYVEASKAERTAYRADIRNQRQAERHAQLWDTPIRNEAAQARTRLANADPKAPETMDDLVSIATEMLLPEKAGGSPRGRTVIPGKFYVDLKSQFPELVTRQNQGKIYKRAYQRVQDMTTAAREAARLKSATIEERRIWNEAGIDTDVQALLIQRAEAQRQQMDARAQMTREFNRVSRSRLGKIGFELQALPRALQSSIDAPIGRQGLFYLVTHPIETARVTIPATVRGYAASRAGYQQLVAEMQKHPDYRLAEKAGVDLPGIASEVDPRVSAEEPFQSTFAERLPHVRLSEQGFTYGMNAQRLAAFSRYADYGRAEGYTWESNPEFFKQAAEYVNAATGRGNMPETLKRATAMTNALFYSTRLQVSRVQLLNNLFNPVKYMKLDPAMRKAAAGEAIRLAAGMALILGTAKMAGLKVTTDPEDADFGKVVWGAVHYDLTGGEGALVRAAYRLVKATAMKINGEKPKHDVLDILWDFTRKKLAPWPGTAVNLAAGKDVVGHPANIQFANPEHKPAARYVQDLQDQNQLVRMVAPMVVGDFIDAANEEGWTGMAKTLPGLGGVGIQAYTKQPRSPYSRASNSRPNPYAAR